MPPQLILVRSPLTPLIKVIWHELFCARKTTTSLIWTIHAHFKTPRSLAPRPTSERVSSKILPENKNFIIFFYVHMDTCVIDNNIKKNFEIFYFLAKFLYSNANAGCDKNHFRCKIFCLHQN